MAADKMKLRLLVGAVDWTPVRGGCRAPQSPAKYQSHPVMCLLVLIGTHAASRRQGQWIGPGLKQGGGRVLTAMFRSVRLARPEHVTALWLAPCSRAQRSEFVLAQHRWAGFGRVILGGTEDLAIAGVERAMHDQRQYCRQRQHHHHRQFAAPEQQHDDLAANHAERKPGGAKDDEGLG